MNDIVSDHPSLEQLTAYTLGQLSEEQAGPISRHIVNCERCCETLEQLADRSDAFLQKLKRVSQSGADQLESDLKRTGPDEILPNEIAGYEVLDLLGRGGMGVVYRVWQTGLNRLVALKMISAGIQASPEEKIRFRQEAEAVAQLAHPNIVQIYDTGTTNGVPFYTMELVEGTTLREAIAGKPWNPKRSAELVESLANAMQKAHEKEIIHRDLKPANVMLVDCDSSGGEVDDWLVHGVPKIMDFGLAKRLNEERDLTQTGTVAGTPGYMAPEQARGESHHIGPQTDVYALGAILYNLITGRPPFQADTSIQILNLLINQDPVSPRSLNPGVDRDLETICLKCLEKEPARRYETAQDLAEDLKRFRLGEPIHARKISATGKIWRWARRNRRLATVTSALLLMLLTAAVAGPLIALSYRRLAQAEQEAADAARFAQRQAKAETERAEEQRKKAEREAALSGEVSSFLLGLFDDADPLAWSGRAFGVLSKVNPTAVEIIDRGARALANKSILDDRPLVRATLLDKIGTVYLSLGQVEEARPLLTEALELRQAKLRTPHLDLAASLHSVGFLNFASGDMDQAEDFFKQALAMRVKLLGEDHPLALESKVQLGVVYLVPPQRDKAGEDLLSQALDVYRARLRQESSESKATGRDIQWTFSALAVLTYHYLDSNVVADRILAIPLIGELQQLARDVPNKDLGGIIVHFIEAEKLRHQGQLIAKASRAAARETAERAEAEYKQALALGEKTGKSDHYMLAWMRRGYGYFLFEQERFQEAELAFLEAYRVFREQFRERTGLHLSQMLHQIALSIQFGRYQQAKTGEDRRQIWEEIHTYIQEAVELDSRSPDVVAKQQAIRLLFLADHLHEASPPRHAESEQPLRRAWEIRRQHFGAESQQVLHPIVLLLRALVLQGKFDEAERLIRETLETNPNREWRPNHVPVLVTVAEAFAENDRPDQAMLILNAAESAGFRNVNRLQRSAAFRPLRARDDFQKLLKRLNSRL